jgi:serine phosphatase RsbU (regulator of sigma subunit)
VSVHQRLRAGREVGGDYFDILPLDDHRVGVLIADVSGKGTSAALYMAEMKGLMLSLSRNPLVAARSAHHGQPDHRGAPELRAASSR